MNIRSFVLGLALLVPTTAMAGLFLSAACGRRPALVRRRRAGDPVARSADLLDDLGRPQPGAGT